MVSGHSASRSILLALLLLALPLAGTAHGETVFAVTTTSPPVLETFDSASPTSVTVVGPVTGLAGAEQSRGIGFRPSTGQLYAVGGTTPQSRIDTATAAATAVGPGFSPAISDAGTTSVGFAF